MSSSEPSLNAVCIGVSFPSLPPPKSLQPGVSAYLFSFPNRKYQNPDWKPEFDDLWDFYLEKVFTNQTVEKILKNLDSALWEDHLSNWRYILASVVPYYIKPSVDILEKEGYITVDEDDEYIVYEESQEESYDYSY